MAAVHAPDYALVFNRLSHVVALSKEGRIRETIDGLVLTTLTVHKDVAHSNSQQVGESILNNYGIALGRNLIQSSLDRLVSDRKLDIARNGASYGVVPAVSTQIHKRIEDAVRLESQVRTEWSEELQDTYPELSSNEVDQLWNCLRSYMARAFQRHGVETIRLLNPQVRNGEADDRSFSGYLVDSIEESSLTDISDLTKDAVRHFFIDPPESRTKYVSNLLDGTFAFFALSVDQTTADFLRHELTPLTIFLDTNFIFGFLDLHNNSMVEVSHELVDVVRTNELPFKFLYHPETLKELSATIGAIGHRLRGKSWTPQLSRAAVKRADLTELERHYHETNAQFPIDPETYLARYDHMRELLADLGFVAHGTSIESLSPATTTEINALVDQYTRNLARFRPHKPKPAVAIRHDMVVWHTVNKLRGDNRSILDARALFMTNDMSLYLFDWHELRSSDAVGVVALPNHILQLLRPFVPNTDRFDRRFVETFAIPEFIAAGGDHSSVHSRVLAHLSAFDDLTEKTASRVLGNEWLMDQIAVAGNNSGKVVQLIESVIVEENTQLLEEREGLEEEQRKLREEATDARNEIAKLSKQLEERVKSESSLEESLEQIIRLHSASDNLRQETDDRIKKLELDRAELENAKSESVRLLQVEREIAAKQARVLTGALMFFLGSAAILLALNAMGWQWLDAHPKRTQLLLSSVLLWLAVCILVVFWKTREIVLAAIAGAISLLAVILSIA